ncbi:MAG: chemotaxis protein MotB [Bdellovibrionaceae bacterium]|nr:chemotaxis protein MotB [Pseudobdellovibrionaceae bacterium]
MAAEKKGQTIVIKKIYNAAGHHGGAWKVALADFMTALMAFFLVMWLLGQSTQTKKAVSDYFSTPSVIEYSFQNFGVELTLEKLFLDLLSEPLKAFQSFLEPIDKTPNVFDFGSQKVVAAYMADQIGDIAKNVSITPDGIEFDIIDSEMFIPGTATPNEGFTRIMTQMKAVTEGLADSTVAIESRLWNESVPGSDHGQAKNVATERLSLIRAKVQSTFENPSNDIAGSTNVQSKKGFVEGQGTRPAGMIHFKIQQKPQRADGKPTKKLETLFGASDPSMNVYDNFVKQVSGQKKRQAASEEDSTQKEESREQ